MATLIKRRRENGSIAYRVQDRTRGYPTVSKTFSTLALARRFRKRLELERESSRAGLNAGNKTLNEVFADFANTDEFRHRKARKGTQKQLEWWANKLGSLPLRDISPALIADHLHRLEAKGRSGATCNRYLAALSKTFKYAIRTRHWIDTNPCQQVERRKEGKRRERVLKRDEWAGLLQAAQYLANEARAGSAETQLANFLVVLYETGARSGEINSLRWEYVDLDLGTAFLPDTKAGEAREVPLTEGAIAAIRKQRIFRRFGNPFVFPNKIHDETPITFHAAFVVARKKAGLDTADHRGEKIVIHTLRHTAATEAAEGGATAFEIMGLTGHKTLAMAQRYTKVGAEQARQAQIKRQQQIK